MNKALPILGQMLLLAVFAAVTGYFAAAPAYVHFPADRAQIKLSFSHSGASIRECRRFSADELAKLAPNMRRPLDCPRERVPLVVEIVLDGEPLFSGVLLPSGLWRDGSAGVYRTFRVTPGRHRLTARLRDSRRSEGFDHERQSTIELAPLQNFVVDFRRDQGGFIFH